MKLYFRKTYLDVHYIKRDGEDELKMQLYFVRNFMPLLVLIELLGNYLNFKKDQQRRSL